MSFKLKLVAIYDIHGDVKYTAALNPAHIVRMKEEYVGKFHGTTIWTVGGLRTWVKMPISEAVEYFSDS